MSTMSWDALPPRKSKAASRAKETPARPTVSGHQQILDNIEARRKQNHSGVTTLTSKDGCRGTFYEYLDHTADVQCHAWGHTMSQAFENMAQCMMNYMTDISLIAEDPEENTTLSVTGHDVKSLLYNYMNELLFKFSSDCFVTTRVEITTFDAANFAITANLYGDIFDPEKHSSGTEIKAITYSNMQVHEAVLGPGLKEEDTTTEMGRVDLFVIVDI